MSNSLAPDQAQQNVGPNLGPNSLQRFSADDTSRQRVIETCKTRTFALAKFDSGSWVIFHTYFVVCWIFSKSAFLKISFRNTTWVSNSLDPDQAGQNVGPDLGPNCLQRLSADNTIWQRVGVYKNYLSLHLNHCHWNLLNMSICFIQVLEF